MTKIFLEAVLKVHVTGKLSHDAQERQRLSLTAKAERWHSSCSTFKTDSYRKRGL